MKKILIFSLVFSFSNVFARKITLEKLLSNYANKLDKGFCFTEKDQKQLQSIVDISLPPNIKDDDLYSLILNALAGKKLTIFNSPECYWVISIREVRHTPFKLYTREDFTDNEEYIMYIHSLKYPLAKSSVRNFRPFLSRYGRVIAMGDNHTVLINDKAQNVRSILELINQVDVESSYNRFLEDIGKNRKTSKSKDRECKTENKKLILLTEKLLEKLNSKNNKGRK